jgi:predicted RNA binding protein YcfA (HicA-like mRNA interferase family)
MVVFLSEGPRIDRLDRVRRLGSRSDEGSHRQFQHPTKLGTVTIAGNPGVDVPAGTLNSVLKQAGLKK